MFADETVHLHRLGLVIEALLDPLQILFKPRLNVGPRLAPSHNPERLESLFVSRGCNHATARLSSTPLPPPEIWFGFGAWIVKPRSPPSPGWPASTG